MKDFFSSLTSRAFPDGRPTVEASFKQLSCFRKPLLFLAFVLLPMLGWGATEVKLVSVGMAATQSSPTYLDNNTVYESTNKDYSVKIISNGVSKNLGAKYDSSKRDYYYAIGSACDMSGTTLANYLGVVATGCKISKIVVRAHGNSSSDGMLPMAGFISGLPDVQSGARVVDTIITSNTVTGISTKKYANAKDYTFNFNTPVKEMYMSKQIRNVIVGSAAKATYPSSAQSMCIYGMEIYVIPIVSHSVTYDLNEGSGTTPTQDAVAEGGSFTVASAAGLTAPDGKEFDCWNDGTNDVAAGATYTMGTNNVILTAKWRTVSTKSAINYENTKSATPKSTLPTEYSEGTGITSFPDLNDVPGFHFTDWSPASISSTATGAQTITAQWEAVPMDIFSMVAVSSATSKKVAAGETIALSASEATITGGSVNFKNNNTSEKSVGSSQSSTVAFMLEKTGSYFEIVLPAAGDGLRVGDVITAKVLGGKEERGVFFTTSSSSTAVTEYFVKTTSGESSNSYKTVTYTIKAGDDLIGEKNIYVERYTGNGTYFSELKITRPVNSTPNTTFAVTFDMNGATSSAINSQSILSGKTATKPTDPEKTNCVFKGWVVTSTDAAYDFSTAVTAGVALKAKWANTYAIKYNDTKEASTTALPARYEEGVGVASFANLENVDGWNFVAWTPTSIAADATGDKEITATWEEAVEYHVYYKHGEGSGLEGSAKKDNGTQVEVAENSFTAPDGQVFRHWAVEGLTGKTTAMPGEQFEMPAGDVTLTAIFGIKHTVKYYDGTTQIGSDVIAWDGEKLTEPANPTKPLNTFDKWMNGTEAYDFNAVVTTDLNLTATWTTAYAQSIDMEQFVIENAKNGDYDAYLTSKNWAYSSVNGLDSLNSDKTANNYPYLGLKFKTNPGYVEGMVKGGKMLIVKNGNLGSATYIVVDDEETGTQLTSATGTTPNVKYFYSDNDAKYKFNSTGSGTNMLKAMLVTDPYKVSYANGGEISPEFFKGESITLPVATGTGEFQGWFSAETGGEKVGMNGDKFVPFSDTTLYAQFSALSTDNSLKTLKYGETSIAIVAEQTEYAVNLPYKTAIPATVTYEANSPVATPTGEQSANVVDGVASFTITAESGDAANYTVTFTVAPKDPLCIIHADITGQAAASVDASKSLFEGTASANSNVKNSSTYGGYTGYKFNAEGAKMSIVLTEETFKTSDIVKMFITTAQNMPIRAYADENAANEVATGAANMVQGINSAVMTANTTSLWLVRTGTNSWNPSVAYVEVWRPMNPILTALSANGVAADIDEANKTATISFAPGADLTNVVLSDIKIVSNTPSLVEGVLGGTAWEDGVARAYTLTDKDGDATVYNITISLEETCPTSVAISGTKAYTDGETIELTASQTGGNNNPTFQWYKDGAIIAGATNATFTKTATLADAGSYVCKVNQGTCDEVASEAAAVTVAKIAVTKVVVATENGVTDIKVGDSVAITATITPTNASIQDVTWVMPLNNSVPYYSAAAGNPSMLTALVPNSGKSVKATVDGKNSNTLSIMAHYLVQFDMNNGGDAIDDMKFYGSGLTLPTPNSTKEGWTFVNWYEDENFTVLAKSSYKPDGHKTLIAKWDIPAATTPVISAQPESKTDYAQGAAFNTLSVTAIPATSYQWYKDGEAIEGATDATYTPTAVGTYYVIVTNSETDHIDAMAQSNNAEVAYRDATDAAITALKYGETAIELVTDQYEYDVELEKGTTEVPALSVTTHSTYATSVANDAPAFVNYAATSTIVITAEDGTTQLTYTVNFTVKYDVEQVSVSGNTTWNWANAASQSIKLTDLKNVEVLMANIEGVNNDADFNSQALVFYGENVKATDGGVNYASIGHIKFTTTVPGLVTVEFADNGSNNRRLMINDAVSESSASKTDYKTFSVLVNAGEVTLMGVKSDKTGINQYIRIRKITFTPATRLDRSDLTAGKVTGICLENNVTHFLGAKFYYLSQKAADESYIELTEVDNLKAGYPYIMIAEGKDVYYAQGTETADEAQNYNGLYGTFENKELGDGYCILLNNKYYRTHDGNNNGCYAHRAYLKLSEVSTEQVTTAPGESTSNPAARRIRLGGEGYSTPTGFDNVGETKLGEPQKLIINNQVVIIRNGQMYNAQGALLK